jgi:hypothetical protein
MVGLSLLAEADAAGLTVTADGGRLVVRGPRRAEPLARRLIENKLAVLPLVNGHLPPDWHVAWDERSAIMEYDGGLPRERAEALALADILAQMTNRPGGDR